MNLSGVHGTQVTPVAVAMLAGCLLGSAHAAVIIPQKSGFSGFINLGAGGIVVESNTLAGPLSGGIELGKEKIESLADSPDDESALIPLVNFELSYTVAETRTQFFIGNLLEDFLRFDINTLAGVRQGIGDAGIIGATLRRAPFPTEVWEDPYVTGTKRRTTDRESQGFGLFWQQILGSGLEIEYVSSEVDIDDERSGEWLGLSEAERKLLNRNGDMDRFSLRYELNLAGGRHMLTPEVRYFDNDLDGAAMSSDGWGLNLNYIYSQNENWRHVINGGYAREDFDRRNPIYSETDSLDRWGVSLTSFYLEPFGWDHWSASATFAWFEQDHDIDFYDQSALLVGFGFLRRF